jgi:two-component system, NtrC family, sensor kinase
VHEVNNPLTGMKLNLELLQTSLLKPEMRDKIFLTLSEGINRIDRIVKGFMAFARQEKPQKRKISIHKILEETLALVANFKQFHQIHIETSLAENLPEIYVDPYRLEQVFINLINNACDAMQENGGNLIISSELDSNILVISFEDTGIGIKQEDLNRVFEPFYSTKTRKQGTGLGLSISYGIIQEHGGTIEVQSRLGVGSTFKIKIPIHPETEKA